MVATLTKKLKAVVVHSAELRATAVFFWRHEMPVVKMKSGKVKKYAYTPKGKAAAKKAAAGVRRATKGKRKA